MLERAVGVPRELIWRLDNNGQARILDVLPLEVDEQDHTEDMLEAIAHATVRMQGGVSAQSGVAAGKVVHIKEGDEPGTFPVGAVAVARAASPHLAPFMLRAGALITELGSSIGHLATVVREYRIPAVFGLKDAFDTLPEGLEVTVGRLHPGDLRRPAGRPADPGTRRVRAVRDGPRIHHTATPAAVHHAAQAHGPRGRGFSTFGLPQLSRHHPLLPTSARWRNCWKPRCRAKQAAASPTGSKTPSP